MEKPFFSIIITTLNEEKFLPRLLLDLKRQKNKDFEVILVDGGSSDKTLAIAKQYQKKISNFKIFTSKVKHFIHQRNYGAEKANGRYLLFIDADIQLKVSYLEEINKEIEKSKSKFLTTYQRADVKNKLDSFLMELTNYTLELLSIMGKPMAPGYNFIVRKDVFAKAGKFNPKATLCEDHELSMKIFDKGEQLTIVPHHLLKWSFRRIRKDGRLPIIVRYTMATVYVLMFGKVTHKFFAYPMGGEYFKEIIKNRNSKLETEFNRYLAKIKRTVARLIQY